MPRTSSVSSGDGLSNSLPCRVRVVTSTMECSGTKRSGRGIPNYRPDTAEVASPVGFQKPRLRWVTPGHGTHLRVGSGIHACTDTGIVAFPRTWSILNAGHSIKSLAPATGAPATARTLDLVDS